MCVTNTTGRRQNPISFNAEEISICRSSFLADRLQGGFTPSAPSVSSQGSAEQEKELPKRRRKPQRPGFTAKNHERHFVVHHYHDHALDQECDYELEDSSDDQRHRRSVAVAFPMKLHEVLEQVELDDLAHVISWQPHGRCFIIRKPKEFVDHVMPK